MPCKTRSSSRYQETGKQFGIIWDLGLKSHEHPRAVHGKDTLLRVKESKDRNSVLLMIETWIEKRSFLSSADCSATNSFVSTLLRPKWRWVRWDRHGPEILGSADADVLKIASAKVCRRLTSHIFSIPLNFQVYTHRVNAVQNANALSCRDRGAEKQAEKAKLVGGQLIENRFSSQKFYPKIWLLSPLFVTRRRTREGDVWTNWSHGS
jgi:hypothetical protein